MWVTWRRAMRAALYGPAGFYARGEPPAHHFRTSAHVPAFAGAVLALLREVDTLLGHPARLDLVDLGAGRGELVSAVWAAAGTEPGLAGRLRAHAVEVAPRPAGVPPGIRWSRTVPRRVTGLVIANEWLDNVPLDVAVPGRRGPRLLLTDPATGAERAGPAPDPADLAWLRTWWWRGERAEIGRARDRAWARVVRRLERGVAVAVDYGHTAASRPAAGTLTGYRAGRVTRPVPDGTCDLTAHVALDSCAQAGRIAGANATVLTTQTLALRALGLRAQPPPLGLADADPAAYLTALAATSHAAELLDPAGLGGFGWLAQSAGVTLPPSLAALAEAPASGRRLSLAEAAASGWRLSLAEAPASGRQPTAAGISGRPRVLG